MFINRCRIQFVYSMASTQQVKQYLAYWFQLGKKIVIDSSNRRIAPAKIFQGDAYSPEFEACWQEITSHNLDHLYLEGTTQSIQQLLSPLWDIVPCARCQMPVPMINLGLTDLSCPCSDLDNWPNENLPAPRSPVNSRKYLRGLTQRLQDNDDTDSH